MYSAGRDPPFRVKDSVYMYCKLVVTSASARDPPASSGQRHHFCFFIDSWRPRFILLRNIVILFECYDLPFCV
jgi:hypothetical protein